MNWNFKTFNEFYSDRKYYKAKYPSLKLEERRQFRDYVYSTNMKEYKQNIIWEYLNDDINDELLTILRIKFMTRKD